MRFEEKYEDVLQNLEWGIVRSFREDPDTLDYDVQDALAALRKHYIADARGQAPKAIHLTERAEEIFDSVKGLCEWRLGREHMYASDASGDKPIEMGELAKTPDEMIACIKKIESSVKLWNKHGGRQGYLNYVEQFIAENGLLVYDPEND